MKTENLKTARQAAGLTRGEVAQLVGITARMYLDYERGVSQPRAHLATKIASTLNSTVEELWGDEAETSKPA